MKTLKIAISLIKIPRLFLNLLFWPLMIGLLITIIEISSTTTYIHFLEEDAAEYKERNDYPDQFAEWVKIKLYGKRDLSAEPRVCRWKEERQPSDECALASIDVAINVENPERYDAAAYVSLFAGSVEKIHICKNCKTDLTLKVTANDVISEVTSLRAVGVYTLVESKSHKIFSDKFYSIKQLSDERKKTQGTVLFNLPGFNQPINLTRTSILMFLIINSSLLIIITLWLTLLGHKKVLQYFAKNDVLLPLVAACGKKEFYGAMWIITLLRVLCFLITSLPANIIIYRYAVPKDILQLFIGNKQDFIIWVFAIFNSLATITVISSISELRNRTSVISWTYKYATIFLFILGFIFWVPALFNENSFVVLLKNFLAIIPIVGLSQVILFPIIKINSALLLLHSLFAITLTVYFFRLNARWFATHLEDI